MPPSAASSSRTFLLPRSRPLAVPWLVFTHRTLLTPNVWGFHINSQFSTPPDTSRVSQRFSPILTPSPWSWCRPHGLRTQSHKAAPTSDTGHKVRASHTSDRLAVNQEFPTAPSGSVMCCNNSQTSGKHCLHLLFFVNDNIKDTNEQTDVRGEGLKLPILKLSRGPPRVTLLA